MPLTYVSAVASGKVMEVTLTDALGYSGLGFAIVFMVLVVLMAFIAVMSLFFKSGEAKADKKPAPVKEQPVKAAPAVSETIKETNKETPAVVPEGAMFVTLGGKRHTVSVVEKLPRFTVTVNGKSHNVDVESVEEGAE